MGQYYNVVIKINGIKEVFDTQVDGEYMWAKLTEHSYWSNPFVLAIASKLWRTKGQLAWVGDYAEESDFNWNKEFTDVRENPKTDLIYNGFRLEGKYFINHSKKMFIDLDKYKELLKDIDMVLNPISLLTAVGNGKGGGDFHKTSGVGYDLIGTWAWDIVEITDEAIYDWKYDREICDWTKTLKQKFGDYVDVTNDYLFIEKYDDIEEED